jgi:prophage antirepressor-like protein
MTNTLVFQNTQFDVVDRNGNAWLRLPQIEGALGYAHAGKAISSLYDRNADEFTPAMTAVIELDTNGGKQQVRIFSLRGCHLLGMLSRTKIAKAFRVWVLDILDKEVQRSPSGSSPELLSSADMSNLSRIVWQITNGFAYEQCWVNAVWHCLRAATSTPAPRLFQMGHIPLLAAECRRIYALTASTRQMMNKAENDLVRRVLRHGEDAEKVLAEMNAGFAQLSASDLSKANGCLAKWGEHDIARFEQRLPCGQATYSGFQERLDLPRAI